MNFAQTMNALLEAASRGVHASRPAGQGSSPVSRPARHAFSLVEVLIAVALMSIIVLGLMATFSQTQRAFRSGLTQADFMEAGRTTLDLLAREVEQVAPTRLTNTVNFRVEANAAIPWFTQNLPGATRPRTNFLQTLTFAARDNQTWSGIGYAVVTNDSPLIGTLYRCETNAPAVNPAWVATLTQPASVFAAQSSRVVDNVVHFRVRAFDQYGRLFSPDVYGAGLDGHLGILPGRPGTDEIQCQFLYDAVPAYAEIELGILDDKTADRARNMPATAQLSYLQNQAGHVHIFRQRIPIRSFDPSAIQ
jgi:prepilin-type N-terminal cleavage/methylation domain-containing protein